MNRECPILIPIVALLVVMALVVTMVGSDSQTIEISSSQTEVVAVIYEDVVLTPMWPQDIVMVASLMPETSAQAINAQLQTQRATVGAGTPRDEATLAANTSAETAAERFDDRTIYLTSASDMNNGEAITAQARGASKAPHAMGAVVLV